MHGNFDAASRRGRVTAGQNFAEASSSRLTLKWMGVWGVTHLRESARTAAAAATTKAVVGAAAPGAELKQSSLVRLATVISCVSWTKASLKNTLGDPKALTRSPGWVWVWGHAVGGELQIIIINFSDKKKTVVGWLSFPYAYRKPWTCSWSRQ